MHKSTVEFQFREHSKTFAYADTNYHRALLIGCYVYLLSGESLFSSETFSAVTFAIPLFTAFQVVELRVLKASYV